MADFIGTIIVLAVALFVGAFCASYGWHWAELIINMGEVS